MKSQKLGKEEKHGAAEPQAWRVTWTERNPLGLWNYHQRVEYAETKDKAVNQALAKIRRDSPHGCVTACEQVRPAALTGE